jgi:hypothetical protein
MKLDTEGLTLLGIISMCFLAIAKLYGFTTLSWLVVLFSILWVPVTLLTCLIGGILVVLLIFGIVFLVVGAIYSTCIFLYALFSVTAKRLKERKNTL